LNQRQRQLMSGSAETGAVTLAALATRLWRERWWLAAFGVAGPAVGVLIGFLTTPVYRVQVLLAPVQSERARGGLEGLASQFADVASLSGISVPSGLSNKAVNLAQLTSRRFTQAFITNHNLLPVMYAKRWDKLRGGWRTEKGIRPPTFDEAFIYFDRRIRKIRDDRKTSLITMTIEWRDRHQAVEWANQIVADINEEIRQREIHESQQSLEYLNRELAKGPPVGLREAIFRLMENHVKSIMVANVRRDFAFQIIDPAMVPDEDRYVRPNWLVLVAGGVIASILAGMIFVTRRTALLTAERSDHSE
jgi:uncharacterized protein involved in exopolysaccharide biosynthesis